MAMEARRGNLNVLSVDSVQDLVPTKYKREMQWRSMLKTTYHCQFEEMVSDFFVHHVVNERMSQKIIQHE